VSDAVRVGPVLEAGAVTDAVVAVLRAHNPGLALEDRGAYVRILAPSPCVLPRDAVERALGAPFPLPGALELIMPSFKGRLAIDEATARWTA
jgi:toluene monooxygenase system protein D